MTKNTIGEYGDMLKGVLGDKPPALSLRTGKFTDIDTWRSQARSRVWELMAPPDIGGVPEVEVIKTEVYDDVQIEYLRWGNKYGADTEALFLKPADAKGVLPGFVALHDHGGRKYFGKEKISRGTTDPGAIMLEHQEYAYGGRCWANELAKRGYGVLVHDTFAFSSRRVHISDVLDRVKNGYDDWEPERIEEVLAYNSWASEHEDVMAKALFSAGTTWPGVFVSEDKRALDYLCSRDDIDSSRIGCGGLSGGGLRTVFLAGLDERISCAFCAGMMTTWLDMALYKNYTHTWMGFLPLLPRELDYPEILGLRAPMPTFVLNNIDDALFTLSEMERADKIMAGVYEKAGCPDNYKCSFYQGPHKMDIEMQESAFDWVDDNIL